MIERLRLHLARSRDFPEGSTRHGYEIVLPLTEAGKLDIAAWEKAPEICTVHRFWEGEGDAVGELVHPRAGAWGFSYLPGHGDDEEVLRFEQHILRTGEYLSIRTHDGQTRAFRIVNVQPAPLPGQ